MESLAEMENQCATYFKSGGVRRVKNVDEYHELNFSWDAITDEKWRRNQSTEDAALLKRISVLQEQKLYHQVELLDKQYYDLRTKVADNLLPRVDLLWAIEQMEEGKPLSEKRRWLSGGLEEREYVYNHIKDCEALDWRENNFEWHQIEFNINWFTGKGDIAYQLRGLNYLQVPIPSGIVDRIVELKKLKLFNRFDALALQQQFITAVNRPQYDPVILAVVTEGMPYRLPYNWEKDSPKQAFYLVGRWTA